MNSGMHNDYIERLGKGLKSLPRKRREEIIADITSHFTEGLADGVSEVELCEMLGAPEALAGEYAANYAVETATENPTPRTVARALWAGLGVAFVNIFFMLWIWIAVGFVWLSIAICSAACGVGGLIGAVLAALKPVVPLLPVYVDYPLIYILGGIAASALGVLMGMFALWSGRHILRGVTAYVKMNVDIVAGRRSKV